MIRHPPSPATRAGQKVLYWIKKGVLVRPTICSRCGDEPRPLKGGLPAIQAHHADYSKPLNVEWICVRCHRDETPLGPPPRGEASGNAKLTTASVLAIRRAYAAGGVTQTELAERFWVSRTAVRQVILRQRWAHLP